MEKTVNDLIDYLNEHLQLNLEPDFLFLYYSVPFTCTMGLDTSYVQGIIQEDNQYYSFIIHFKIQYNHDEEDKFNFLFCPLQGKDLLVSKVKKSIQQWHGNFMSHEGMAIHSIVYSEDKENVSIKRFEGVYRPNQFRTVQKLMTQIAEMDEKTYRQLWKHKKLGEKVGNYQVINRTLRYKECYDVY